MDWIVLILIMLAVTALFNPLLGLYAFFIVAYSRPQDMNPALIAIEPAKWIIVLTCISFLFYKLREQKGLVGSTQTVAILGILSAIVLSRAQALDLTMWAAAFQDFVLVCLVYFLITNIVNTPKKLRYFYIFFLLLNFFIAYKFYMGYRAGTAYYHGSKPGTETFGFLGNADDLGLGMVVAFPLALIPVFYAKRIPLKFFSAGICLFFILSALATQSRGAIFGVFAVFIVSILFHLKGRKLRKRQFAVGLAIALFLFAGFYYKYRWTLKDSYESSKNEEDPGRAGRISTWQAARQMIKDSPVVGVGRNNYVAWWKAHYPPGIFGYQVAHNVLYEVTAETGVIGLFFFLLFSLYGLRQIKQIRRRYRLQLENNYFIEMLFTIYTIGLIGFFFNGMFITVAFYWHIYVLTALFVSARNVFLEKVVGNR